MISLVLKGLSLATALAAEFRCLAFGCRSNPMPESSAE
jgi:hypothetical protein